MLLNRYPLEIIGNGYSERPREARTVHFIGTEMFALIIENGIARADGSSALNLIVKHSRSKTIRFNNARWFAIKARDSAAKNKLHFVDPFGRIGSNN